MDISGTYRFDAPPQQVWALLMDTDAIARCIPGCRALRPVGPNRYETELSVAVAAISGDFSGTIELADLRPPESYRLLVNGTGRPGFVRGTATITLAPDGNGTAVQVAASAQAGGLIARVGQRLLEGVARMTMDRFYQCLAGQPARSEQT
ncbi:MAG: carbon monoxide dehydrogenase subunit G [Acidobacteria bacterium]|nr:carbon monoxide dehydrogenase subunit G [Acidobacteriota bacterium]